jgi:hypothetical protein
MMSVPSRAHSHAVETGGQQTQQQCVRREKPARSTAAGTPVYWTDAVLMLVKRILIYRTNPGQDASSCTRLRAHSGTTPQSLLSPAVLTHQPPAPCSARRCPGPWHCSRRCRTFPTPRGSNMGAWHNTAAAATADSCGKQARYSTCHPCYRHCSCCWHRSSCSCCCCCCWRRAQQLLCTGSQLLLEEVEDACSHLCCRPPGAPWEGGEGLHPFRPWPPAQHTVQQMVLTSRGTHLWHCSNCTCCCMYGVPGCAVNVHNSAAA